MDTNKVFKVKCINDFNSKEGAFELKNGKIYDAIEYGDLDYLIIVNPSRSVSYSKNRFEIMNEPASQIPDAKYKTNDRISLLANDSLGAIKGKILSAAYHKSPYIVRGKSCWYYKIELDEPYDTADKATKFISRSEEELVPELAVVLTNIGKSYTFTLDEVKEVLRKSFIITCGDLIDDLFSHGRESTLRVITRLSNLDNWEIKDIIDEWVEVQSEIFFAANPNIDDALVLISEKTDNCPSIKEWMVSRK